MLLEAEYARPAFRDLTLPVGIFKPERLAGLSLPARTCNSGKTETPDLIPIRPANLLAKSAEHVMDSEYPRFPFGCGANDY